MIKMQQQKKTAKKVLVFGTFDGIHPGHIHFLTEAKKLGDLYVSVASDESLKFRKLHSAEKKASQRLKDIKALGITEGASIGDKVLGNWTDVRKVRPDIIALGYDQKGLEIALKNAKKELGLNFIIKKITSFGPKKFHSSILKKVCAYCTIPEIKKRTILENKYAWAFPTNIPVVPGHLIIAPKRCTEKFEDLTENELRNIFTLLLKLKKSLEKTFKAEGFNFAWNEGEVGGQSVPHFHLQILPRRKGDTGVLHYEPRKYLYLPKPKRAIVMEKELGQISKKIKKNL